MGYSENDLDCDDEKAPVSPNATEICGNEIDDDCNGLIDGADANPAGVDWYVDADGDGYGSDIYLGNSCSMTGVPNSDDCDDNDPSISPNASDQPYDGLDTDCDGQDDYDSDGDGFIASPDITGLEEDPLATYDCDDEDENAHPNATELCASTIDENCDGIIDECDGEIVLTGTEVDLI